MQAVLSSSLKLVGSCRGPGDEERIRSLQDTATTLGLEECVEWCINAPHDDVRRILGGAIGGLHTMLDEHFGISIVEYMAAGVDHTPPYGDLVTYSVGAEFRGSGRVPCAYQPTNWMHSEMAHFSLTPI